MKPTLLMIGSIFALTACALDMGDPGFDDTLEPGEALSPATSSARQAVYTSLAMGNQVRFDWDCHPGDGHCTFDATGTVINEGTIAHYEWSFGDFTKPLVDSPIADHSYPTHNNPTVRLDLVMNGSLTTPSVECTIKVRNVVGPPQPLSGTCVGLAEVAVTPVADAYVAQDQPDTQFGTGNALRVRHTDSGIGRHSFIEFDIPAVLDVQSASLELRTAGNVIPETGFYRVDNMIWDEKSGITWNNWRGPNTTFIHLGSLTNLAANSTHVFDVTGNTAPGLCTFGLASGADLPGLDFKSRHTSYPPVLRILFQP